MLLLRNQKNARKRGQLYGLNLNECEKDIRDQESSLSICFVSIFLFHCTIEAKKTRMATLCDAEIMTLVKASV